MFPANLMPLTYDALGEPAPWRVGNALRFPYLTIGEIKHACVGVEISSDGKSGWALAVLNPKAEASLCSISEARELGIKIESERPFLRQVALTIWHPGFHYPPIECGVHIGSYGFWFKDQVGSPVGTAVLARDCSFVRNMRFAADYFELEIPQRWITEVQIGVALIRSNWLGLGSYGLRLTLKIADVVSRLERAWKLAKEQQRAL